MACSLNYYLWENNISSKIIDYAKENMIDINYICYHYVKQDETHHIITNYNRYITISSMKSENKIIDNRRHFNNITTILVIHFDNIRITVSKEYNVLQLPYIKPDVFTQNINKNKSVKITSKNIVVLDQKILSLINYQLDTISFSRNFNKTLKFDLYNTKVLKFNNLFNQPISKLPNSIKELYFGSQFNSIIYDLPDNLEILHFGHTFNKDLNGILPKSLKTLVLGNSFNKMLDILNLNLLSLTLGSKDHDLVFPITLKYLNLGGYNKKLTFLPFFLEELVFGKYYNIRIDQQVLPSSLISITFGLYFDQPFMVPSTLKKLTFGNNFNQIVDISNSNLTVLTFGKTYSKPLYVIPESLIKLYIPKKCAQFGVKNVAVFYI